jgi:hypothetical protein
MKCPGQDTQYWKPGAIFEVPCPECGKRVEFFKDDTARRCSHCGHRFVNPEMDFGCASYCPYAEQCLGTLPAELVAEKENLLKDRVAVAMKRHYGTDFSRIGQATRTARHAEAVGRETGANLAVVLCAAYLVDMEEEAARSLLERLGARPSLVDAVTAIVEGHRRGLPPSGPEAEAVQEARKRAREERKGKEATT